jgi:hypothetical protein
VMRLNPRAVWAGIMPARRPYGDALGALVKLVSRILAAGGWHSVGLSAA